MSETERRYYHTQIAGCERDLPLCPISDTTEIAGFVMLGDVEITEHTAAELLEKCPAHDVIITALKGNDRYTDVSPSCRNITLIPFLLTCGHHAAHEINTGCREHFMKRGYSVTTVESGILSLFPGIREIFIRHMKELEKE